MILGWVKCFDNMGGLTRKLKSRHRPIDDDTRSESGIVDDDVEHVCK